MTDLATILTTAREQAGYSRTDLADAAGVTRQFVRHLETGLRKLRRPDDIANFARLLSIDPDVLWVASGTIPPDIAARLVSDLDAVRTVRVALDMPTPQE